MFLRTQTTDGRTYLLLVENERTGRHVRQRILHRFGRLDELRASGQLDALTAAFGRYSEKLLVIGSRECEEALRSQARRIGGPLVFERLWEDTGLRAALTSLLASRRFGFAVERAVFLTVLHRLLAPGSDRAADRWKTHYVIDGVDGIDLYQVYRAMAWLGAPLRASEQAGATPFAPRTTKDLVEERLFARRPPDLLSSLHLVFFDTTSIYFEGAGGDTLGHHGHSKDHRPDLKQMVVGVVLDMDGRPICCELWPGNTTDVKTLVPIVDRLRTRFQIGQICIVADRGMISDEVLEAIEQHQWSYILGVRMRTVKAIRDQLGEDDVATYHEVFPKSDDRRDPSPLKVREITLEGRRYVLCYNEDQAVKDRHDREAIVAALQKALGKGAKELVGNKGFRRYLKSTAHFEVDDAKVTDDERFDGKWVLTTNTGLSATVTALAYKQLWMVENVFRSMKSVLDTRPIYHKRDETIRGHVFCSFLALVLRTKLEEQLAARKWKLEWADIVRDLDGLEHTTLSMNGKTYVVRSDVEGTAGKVFQAVGDNLRCLDLATGKELWNFAYPAPGKFDHPGSRTSPSVDGDKVYTFGPLGDLCAVSTTTHKPIWQKNAWQDGGGGQLPRWALTQNPLVYRNFVIVASQAAQATVVAYDKLTGELKWQSPVLTGLAGYVSPSLVKVGGEDHLVMVMAARGFSRTASGGSVNGLDPLTGKLLWTYSNFNCGIPVPHAVDAGEGRVLMTGGYSAGAAMIKVQKKADGTFEAIELFKNFDFGSHTQPPILYKDHFYVPFTVNERSDGLVCMTMDGKVKWKTGDEPSFDKGGAVLADGLLLSVDGNTKLYLIEPDPAGFKPLASAQVLEPGENWAPIALVDGKLLIRDQKQMKCLLVAQQTK